MKYVLPILLIIIISCETVVTPELPNDPPQLVVYSFFRPGEPIRFDVFRSVSIFNTPSFEQVRGLTIELFQDGSHIESVGENQSDTYTSTSMAQTGATYRFEITTADGVVLSESFIPESVDIDQGTFSTDIQDINLGEYGYPASVTFTDQADEANYYLLEVLVDHCEDGCETNTVSGNLNEILVEDVKVDNSGNTDITIGSGPEDINGSRYLYLSDNGFDGQAFTLDFYVIPTLINPDDPTDVMVRYVLKSINEEYYQYLLTSDYQRQIEEEGTLAEPVQIFSNVQNGLGVFAGYGLSVYEIGL